MTGAPITDTAIRLHRSALYLPASNARTIDKARTLDCDVVILDLEDAVAPDAKSEARDQAVAAVRAGSFGRREVVIRVNALGTPWAEADLAAAADCGADAVLVPKLETVSELAAYQAALASAPADTGLWGMIETPRAILSLAALAEAAEGGRLSALVMGVNDLAKAMRCRGTPDRAPLWGPLSLSVAAARMAGLTILDGVFNDLENAAGFEAECVQGVDFGFDGKTLIHPSQIEACNRLFAPSEAEATAARRIVEAFARPENANLGAIRVDGRMTERLHLDIARRTLAVAEAIEERAG